MFWLRGQPVKDIYEDFVGKGSLSGICPVKDSHLSFLFSNGLLLTAVYVLKALQKGQQGGAGSLRGSFIVHLSGATFPEAQQQQNSRHQLTGHVKGETTKVKKEVGKEMGIKRIRLSHLRVPLCTASSRRMARARCWS